MNILVLNGSPRPNGNTSQLVKAFTEGATGSGHQVTTIDVCKKNIHGCLACEYCHTKGNGTCIQKDDFAEVAEVLRDSDMLVLASPIYYHNVTGQLKCTIDRFYAPVYPYKFPKLKKIAMILCSGDPDMYEGAKFSYQGDFLDFLNLEDMGVLTLAGSVTRSKLEEAKNLGASL
ncbi:flavodoxin family protein [Lachnospira pectinoschiza]|nr:flavodoxin family protein [Lachnospira pectinoschiza]